MKITTLLTLTLTLTTLLTLTVATPTPSKMIGVNFLNGQWSSAPYTSPSAATSLSLLINTTSSNTLMLSFALFQPSVYAPGPIYNRTSSPPDAALEHAVKAAKTNNLLPILRPLIDPDWSNTSNAGTWRGEIGRGFSPQAWEKWFEAYTPVALHYASLSHQWDLPVYCVGAELVKASHQVEAWRTLLKAVRGVYSGKIMYAANHGNEVLIEWWDDPNVDIIGIDAYYTLFVPGVYPPKVGQVIEAWDFVKTELESLSTAAGGKPVFFAEIGYCSVPEPWIDPAHCLPFAPVDLDAQALAYDAVLSAFLPLPWFAGITFWDWSTQPNGLFETPKSGFSPANKPAAHIIANHIALYQQQ